MPMTEDKNICKIFFVQKYLICNLVPKRKRKTNIKLN